MYAALFLRKRPRLSAKQRSRHRQRVWHVLALFFLCAMTWLTFHSFQSTTVEHTQATVNAGCQGGSYSVDGDPYPLCPGPFPAQGGNCVWWAWEQWHLLGYNLPVNWGNAANWAVDAERFGLPVGTQPRVGALAVFPVADGVWAYGSAGHVAFVTWVSGDSQTFNVTYQNYGDPTPMYIGRGYSVSAINQARFQNGQLRFIYFPRLIDQARFAKLPGVSSSGVAAVSVSNTLLAGGGPNGSLSGSRVGLGLPPGAYDQQFDADFTGNGFTDLLLYNRQAGRLDVLALTYPYEKYAPRVLHNNLLNDPQAELQEPYRVSLQDAHTPSNGWGSNLDIHLGDFTGSGHTEILLYDRLSGRIQILLLTPQLTIARHITLPGWGPGWELYTGQFDGQHTDLFLYKRFAIPTPLPQAPGTGNPGATGSPGSSSPSPSPSPANCNPTPPAATPTAKPSPTASPTVSPTPSPTASPTVSPTPSPTASPTVSPTPSPTASPTVSPTPSPTGSPTVSPTASPTPTPSRTPGATPSPTPPACKTATPAPRTSTPVVGAGGGGGGGDSMVPLNSLQMQNPLGAGVLRGTGEPTDTSGKAPPGWNTSGMTAEILLVNFNQDGTVKTTQDYALWHNSWEVYIGRFVDAHRDGVFLYDRLSGEARLVAYTDQLTLAQFQFVHALGGNWEIHTGDFRGQGQAQILLYDPTSGNAQMLILDHKLAVANQLSYTDWGANMVLYVGHFGLPSLSVMLYDPQKAQSTFISFDSSLNVANRAQVRSWGATSQILVGSFLDRALCLEQHTCVHGDDLLVLDRRSGLVQQYVFSFGNQFSVYDNRVQAFLRTGAVSTVSVFGVDASLFSLLTSEDSTIHSEELY